jgi:acetyl-CoA carboxylase biotin carboxyl carrier protein
MPEDLTKLVAPMPGKVVGIGVKVGDQVKSGQEVITLESMKMEIPIKALGAGVVKEVKVNVGDSVKHGDVLIEFAA